MAFSFFDPTWVNKISGFFSFPSWDVMSWIGKGTSFLANLISYAIVAFIIWIILVRPLLFKIRVDILNKTIGGGILIEEDRGRFKRYKKTGMVEFKLLKNKKAKIPVPDQSFLANMKRKGLLGGMGEKLYLAKLNEITFIPLDIKDTWQNSPFEAVNIDVYNSLLNDDTQIEKKYDRAKWFEKYGNYVVVIVVVVFAFLMYKALIDQSGSIARAFAGATDSFGHSLQEGMNTLARTIAEQG